jgi:hypothetical protein
MQAKPEVFAPLTSMLPTLEIKQGLVWCIRHYQDVVSHQVSKKFQKHLECASKEIHEQI